MSTLQLRKADGGPQDAPLSQGRSVLNGKALYTHFGKRAVDILLAVLMLPILGPVIAILWLLVRRDGGAGFFGHKRIGQGGKVFRCWKIRTMELDAERKLRDYLSRNPEAAAEWERDHKLIEDPRITDIGGFLRRTSLDELPQLWNVIKGDMSFVGPRPIVRSELKKYGPHRYTYLSMKPGVTGLWQVSGRNDVSYHERVQMDVEYLSAVSLGLDLRLVYKTGAAVMKRTGR